MGARGPCARPRRLLASVSASLLVLALALIMPSAQALEECAMYSKDGLLITDEFWDVETLSLKYGPYATDRLLDTSGPNFVYYTFRTENIVSAQINAQTFKDSKYFSVRLDGNSLEIRTSELFDDIEKDTDRDTGTDVYLMLQLGCGSVTNIRRLQLDLQFEDSNNWWPTVPEEAYALHVPVPLPAGSALLEVRGVDYDITGLGVDVRVEGAEGVAGLFSASTSTVSDRAFTLRLSSAMEIRVKEPVSFTLRITDRGTEDDKDTKRDTAVQVTFTPDLANSVFSPRFEHPLYTTSVREQEEVAAGGAVLAAPIAFEEGYADDLTLALDDGGAHAGVAATEFVDVARVGQGVALRWRAGVDADRLAAFLEQPYALLVLTATAANAPQTGRTVIHLALPGAYTESSTTSTTECPTTCEDCPKTDSPVCSTEETPCDCSTTVCPPNDCSTESSTTSTTECPTTCEDCPKTDSPVCSTEETPCDCSTTVCPPNDCSTCTTENPPCDCTTTVCPPTDCSTESSTTSTTECPTTCEDCPKTDSPVCSTEETPCDCSTESPTTSPTVCPTTCEDSTATVCPDCSTEAPPTECPPTATPTVCPPTDCVSTESPSTVCPTCPVECPSTESPSEETPEPSLQLRFEKDTYSRHLRRDDPKGAVVAQPRLANAAAVSGVRFSLESVWETSPDGLLAIDSASGDVTLLLSPAPAGTYLYRLVASASGARPAHAQLLVLGPAGVMCDEESGEECYDNAVQVVTTPENAPLEVLPALRDAADGCSFITLFGREHFDVDADTGAARVKALDREDEAFGGAEAPVVRLSLRMSCGADSTDTHAPADPASAPRDAGDWTQMLRAVPNDQHSTMVLVVLEDVNDNTPQFEPSTLVVGFPDMELAQRLRLPALFTAQATDRDVRENAALRYSLDAAGAAVLQVDALTGAVYPRSDAAPAHGQRVVVHATDRLGQPGDPDTNTGDLQVTLVSLSEEHLVEVQVDGALPQEVEQLLADGADSSRDLRLLSATVLPGKADSSPSPSAPLRHLLRARRAAPDPQDDDGDDDQGSGDEDEDEDEDGGDEKTSHAHLRVVLYSLRNGNPETADQFQKEVEEALKKADWEAKVEKPALGGGGGGGGGHDKGLEAAVITLGVLLGVFLLATGVAAVYWFGIRPRQAQKQRLRNDDSPSQLSVVDIEPLREDMVKKPPSPDPSFGDKRSLAEMPAGGAERPSMMLGLPGEHDARDAESDDYVPEPSDGYERPRPASEHPYEELLPGPPAGPDADEGSVASDQPAPRKTVIFNEAVDCIEIRM